MNRKPKAPYSKAGNGAPPQLALQSWSRGAQEAGASTRLNRVETAAVPTRGTVRPCPSPPASPPFITVTTWSRSGRGPPGRPPPGVVPGQSAYQGVLGERGYALQSELNELARASRSLSESRWAAEGYADDTADLWSEDGRLLARFRQVAAVFPPGR